MTSLNIVNEDYIIILFQVRRQKQICALRSQCPLIEFRYLWLHLIVHSSLVVQSLISLNRTNVFDSVIQKQTHSKSKELLFINKINKWIEYIFEYKKKKKKRY